MNLKTLDCEDPIEKTAQIIFGISFPYPWQRLVIASVLDALVPANENEEAPEPLRRIAVLPTGAGKSLCWMLPAVMSGALTVAVFPLLSLMSDQKRRLDAAKIPCAVLRGGLNAAERRDVWNTLENGEIHIILANPEILAIADVSERIKALKPRFLVVDETHTVSQWGETFRPACAELGRLVTEWNPDAVLALTATAGPHVRERITDLLFNGERPSEALADPDRPAIRYGVLPTLSRFHILERLVREEQRPCIIFGPTRSSVETAARILRHRLKDEEIRYYHAGLLPAEKKRLEDWFLSSRDGILCATCAYGMGVDKSNIRTVVHLAPPSSAEAYLQESGRASRDGKGAKAWLILTPEDTADYQNPDNPKSAPHGKQNEYRSSQAASKEDLEGPAPLRAISNSPLGTMRTSGGKTLDASSDSPESLARVRRDTILRYALSAGRCRREMLLESLGIEAQDCTGCDVCGGEVWKEPPEFKSILKTVRRNNRRFGKGRMARILIGRRTMEIRRLGLDQSPGFGCLAGWELEDAEEAIEILIHSGIIRYGRALFGKRNVLTVNPFTHQTRMYQNPIRGIQIPDPR